jgi:flagellar export protein FliJ
VTGFLSLLKLAEQRAETALRLWQRLDAQCADATDKLIALERHSATYRGRLDGGLSYGASSGSIAAQLCFIQQIEAVALRQRSELSELEAARARQWQELLLCRRERRIYEILGERAAARAAAQTRRRGQKHIDELAQRAASRPPPRSLREGQQRAWE